MDRLRRHDPRSDGPHLHWVSSTLYLASVERDIQNLLRTEISWSGEDFTTMYQGLDTASCRRPIILNSILSYGLPILRGRITQTALSRDLAMVVSRVIRVFEPRVNPDSLRISTQDAPKDRSAVVADEVEFSIAAEVRMKPVPEHLLFKACFTPALNEWRFPAGGTHGS